jgi:Tautomerase enzyme
MSSPISAHRTPIPSSIDPRWSPESWMRPNVPRSPSALVIIWTCDRNDIQVGRHNVVGVFDDDRHEVLTQRDPEGLNVAPSFLGVERSADAVLIQITSSEGRTVAQKQAFSAALVASLKQRRPRPGRCDDPPARFGAGELVVRPQQGAVRRR